MGRRSKMGLERHSLLVKGEAAEGNNLSQLNCKTVFYKDENSLREDEIVGEIRRDDDEEEVDPSAPRIWFSDVELEEMRRPWWNSVIIKLMGNTMGYRNFSARIKDLWARDVESEMKIIDLALGYFVVRFSSYKDCEYVLTSGPWRIANRYLAVRKWEPDFHPSRASLATTVWVRFPGLPIEFYDEELLFKMGNMVGKTIKVEKVTREVVRRGFARVAVQINLDKPLVSKFRLGISIQIVQYEGIHMVCFNCGLYGHKKDQCLGNREQQMLETTKMQPKNNVPSDSRTSLKTQESIKFQVIRRDA